MPGSTVTETSGFVTASDTLFTYERRKISYYTEVPSHKTWAGFPGRRGRGRLRFPARFPSCFPG